MNNRDYKYFEHAKHIAMLSDSSNIHIGYVAVLGNRIVSTGYNTPKTHPLQAHYNRFRDFNGEAMYNHTLHAEIACILPLRHADINWSKVKLYGYRIRGDIGKGIARPCKACMAALRSLGIQDVYYTTDGGFAHEEIA